MEKAIDFCFRTGGTAGSVVTTQIAIVRSMPSGGISSAYLPNARLQPFRGIVLLDRLTLYDHGGVTAFDAAGGRGDGAGDIAGGQEHR